MVRKQPELDEGAYYAGFSPRMLTDTYGEPSAVRQTEHFEIWEYDFDLMFRPLVLDKDAIITGHHYRIGTEGITHIHTRKRICHFSINILFYPERIRMTGKQNPQRG